MHCKFTYRPKRQKLTITFTVRQANTHNCTHRTHPEMPACLIIWDVSVTQTDQPNFRPDNTHFTPPGPNQPDLRTSLAQAET